ncbi:nitroreductase/quinone reductase family protein [Tengunoibacter tsumagoiensis]|uniref:FAD-binding domain-containing protein n=1 Tax=Tengunoibacter tsumagoiensis TaxID=2014871 RepID=A0A402A7A4_9CHLR|nr:nitroreductase/quinone reductase family protein [Tengunoibacter tsumagoiensis]GCE14925.1 hypothetical protein KTT_47840 [Tengunoibacter tsumagoiensis]
MDTIQTQVIIVGGAVAGGSLACALAYQGIHSVLLEKRKTPTDLNRGDGMQPRSLEIMEEWGLLSAFEKAGAIPAYGIEMYHPFLGKLLEIDLGVVKTAHPHLLNLPHRDIEVLLLEHARKSGYCQILYGNASDLIMEEGRAIGVSATIAGSEIEIYAPVIAGADGAQSALRRKIGIEVAFQEYEHDLLVLHAQRPDWFTGKLRTRVFLHQDGAAILLPLPDEKVRLALLVPAGQGGQWKMMTEEALLHQLIKRNPRLGDLKGIEKQGEHIYRMRKMHAPTYAAKGVVLLGDAAHVTHAAGGLGMNMALQDAHTLAAELASAFQHRVSFDQAYSNYERLRYPVNQGVIDRAEFMSKQLWTPSQRAFWGRALSLAIPHYLLPFLWKKITTSLAWRNAGILTPTPAKRSPFPALIVALYRLSQGRIGGHSHQNPVLLLSTQQENNKMHTVPLLFFPKGDQLLIVASNGGSDLPPQWYRNLQRNQQVILHIGSTSQKALATVADQDLHAELWPWLIERYAGLEAYQKKTPRQLAIILLQQEVPTEKKEPEFVAIGAK